MTQGWQPGTSYDLNAVVEYQGHKYRAIQPHNSQPDSTPIVSPEFWGRIPGDTTNDDPKELEISDGSSLSASAFGRDFSGSRWERDEERRQGWSEEDWLRESEQRTKDYWAHGPCGPVTWIPVEGRDIPDRAIFTGEERGQHVYTCRAWHEGSLQVGKASSSFKLGGIIGYANREHHVSKYEVLVGDMHALRWNECHGRLNVAALPGRPVEGGREADSTPLFVAKAPYHGAEVPGKCSERHSGALIPYGGEEKEIRQFQVLCYA